MPSLPLSAAVCIAATFAATFAGATMAAEPPAAPQYRSAYTDYQPYRDEPMLPWRAVNEEVARVGGHAGIFGGAHAGHGTAPAQPAPAAKPTAPAKPAHGAHH